MLNFKLGGIKFHCVFDTYIYIYIYIYIYQRHNGC